MHEDEHNKLCRMQTLRVSRIDAGGVWLEAGQRQAHLPLKEAPDVAAGDQVEVLLYQDSAGDLQATVRRPLVEAGHFALLTVRLVGPHGAFLDWGLAKDLLAPFSLQPERMQVGKSYVVKVEVDRQGRPFANGRIKECLLQERPDLREGAPVNLLVWQLTDLGAKVIVDDRYAGLLYRDELSPDMGVGRRLAGYVKRVRPYGKLDVTMRKVGAEGVADARDVVIKALREHDGRLPLHDGSPPETIRALLGMSKKTFKKAVGGLYKEGVVTLDDRGVMLTGKGPARD